MRAPVLFSLRPHWVFVLLILLGSLPAIAEPLQYEITGEVYQGFGPPSVPVGTFTILTVLDSGASLTLSNALPFTMQHSDISTVINNPVLGCCGWPFMPNSEYGEYHDSAGGALFWAINFCSGCASKVPPGKDVIFNEGAESSEDELILKSSGVVEVVNAPEPGIFGLLALGLTGIAIRVRKKLASR